MINKYIIITYLYNVFENIIKLRLILLLLIGDNQDCELNALKNFKNSLITSKKCNKIFTLNAKNTI